MESRKITEENAISFPVGSLISSRVPSQAVGDLLQVHEFLFRFQDVLGVKEPLSFEELETELLCSWPDCLGSLENCTHAPAKSSILGDKLTVVYMTLLHELVISKLLDRIDSAVDLKLVMLPVNQLTWPEVVRRYIMAYALLTSSENNNNNNIKLIRCLYGDGGIYCGSSSAGVAGVDLDARLLGRAVDNVFGKLEHERNTSCMGQCGVVSNVGSIPEWAKVLAPVRKLPTNVGSRIRHFVNEALKKNPPEWAKEQLEASIAKDVYKGNASGPTKNAVKAVLDRVESDVAQRLLRPSDREDVRRRPELLCRVLMKKCYYVLGCVVATGKNKNNFSDLAGMDYISNVSDLSVVLGSASTRPLDLQTINFRLLHGTYGASHEAFLEDVRDVEDSLKLWIKLKKIRWSTNRLVKLDNMSKDFDFLYENEVASFFSRFFGFEFTAKVEQELEGILASVKIPETPLESVMCQVCGINRYGNLLLLCDTNGCTSAYHTDCLDPPLSGVPKGNWYCPTCVRPNEPQGTRQILQFVDERWKEGSELLDFVIALEETEYWELEADKKIILLKQLCEESLHTALIRRNFNKYATKQAKTFLGIDSAGSIYWGFLNAGKPCGIVVNGNIPSENSTKLNPYDSSTWCLFHSDEEINNLVNYLTIIDPEKTELIDSVLKWHQSITQGDEQTKMSSGERSTVYSTLLKKSPSNCLVTKATALLEATFGEPDEAVTYVMESGRKSMAKWNRCDCLEPIFHSRYHCARCHETFFTNIELQQHNTGTCRLDSLEAKKPAVDWLKEINFPVPESSLKPITGKSLHILRQLKINLLDMEAALPVGAKRSSRASPEWRSAWCAFVKTANTIYEMVEATLVFETMIKTEYIKNTWWWYWSSVSAAVKTSTMSALALRIYTLDAAIDYQKISSSPDQKQPRKMRKTSEKAKEKSKKAKDPEEKINNMDVAVV